MLVDFASIKIKVAKKIKRKKINSNKTQNDTVANKDKFSFDDEIIIGVTKIPENQKVNTKKKNIKNKKKTKKNKNKRYTSNKINLSNEDVIKKRNKVIKIVKYTTLLTLIVVAIVVTMFSPLFNIKEITVIGNKKISEEEIISLSQIQKDENTFKVGKIRTIRNIKQNAYIENVQIKRKLPSEIQIIVEERKASFMLEYGGGFVYINNQGYILEISTEKLNLPIIQGQATEDQALLVGGRLISDDLQKLSTVLKIMEIAGANGIASLITRIDIQNVENYKIVFEGEGKTAYLGDCSSLSTRMLNVKAILEREKGIEGEIFVDMDLNTSYPTFRQKV